MSIKTCWENFEIALQAGVDRILLYGPPGTGKTYTAMRANLTSEQRAFRLTCTDDMTNMDVTGGYMPSQDGGFDYLEGAGIKAWGFGGLGQRLVVDEIDKAGGDVFATLLNLLDTGGSATWDHPVTGVTHRPEEGFSAVMTTNVEQVEALPSALLDRFPVRIRINTPHPAALETLPFAWREYAVNMADAGTQRLSLRTFQAIAKLKAKTNDIELAASLVLGDKAPAFLEAVAIDKFQAVPQPVDAV